MSLSRYCEKEAQKQYPWLGADIRCETLVIGGGILGCAICREESVKGKDTVLLSAVPIGYQSEDTCPFTEQGGMMLSALSKKIGTAEAVLVLKNVMRAKEKLVSFCKEKNIAYSERDVIIGSNSTRDLDKLYDEYRVRLHNGFDVEFMTAEELREQYSFPMKAAVRIKSGIAAADPCVICRELLEGISARIFEQTEAVSIEKKNGYWEVSTATRHTVRAQEVYIADPEKVKTECGAKRRAYISASGPCSDFSGYLSKAQVRLLDRNILICTDSEDRITACAQESGAVPKFASERRFLRLESECAELLNAARPIFDQSRAVKEYSAEENGLFIKEESVGLYVAFCGRDELTAAFLYG